MDKILSEPRTCPISGKSLEGFHGNRKIHPEAEKRRKKETNRMRHSKVKEINKTAIYLDKILEYYYQVSEGVTEIDKSMLSGFRWDFIIRVSDSKPPIFWIIDYGYSYNTKKDKIIIHYGHNTI